VPGRHRALPIGAAAKPLAASGFPVNAQYLWFGDTGANRTLSGDTKDFVPDTLKPADLVISVAKAGVTMRATAIGDCDLHTFDQHGKPYTLRMKDVLYVSGAAENLLSLTTLGDQGYQYIRSTRQQSCVSPWSAFAWIDSAEPKYIPLQLINGLSYIATRTDMHDPNGRVLTRTNKYVQWHRNLGFVPMATLRKAKNVVEGLDALT
jgi:hypothetical protein